MSVRKRNILFISYFYEPMQAVGVKRIAYWARHITAYGYHPLVLTATAQPEEHNMVRYVKPQKPLHWYRAFVRDQGLGWIEPLADALRSYQPDAFDVILITGGPFMQMLLTSFIRQHFRAKIVLDFRDPFYGNPRFDTSFLKDKVKAYFQRRFLRHADLVLTVNEECRRLIDFDRVFIIDNGFDEEVLLPLRRKEEKYAEERSLMAVGRIDEDFDLQAFGALLQGEGAPSFYYAGKHRFAEELPVHHLGVLSYRQVLQELNKHAVVVMFTTGHAFESTTKIFDFLGLGKKIIIITQGTPRTGSLGRLTAPYPHVFWSVNEQQAIKESLDEAFAAQQQAFDSMHYSRAAGLKKLVEILEE